MSTDIAARVSEGKLAFQARAATLKEMFDSERGSRSRCVRELNLPGLHPARMSGILGAQQYGIRALELMELIEKWAQTNLSKEN